MDEDLIISQTRQWIIDVVVGCNFCPFANREIKRNAIQYVVLPEANSKKVLNNMTVLLEQLQSGDSIETSLLILPDNYNDFYIYLDLINEVEEQIIEPNFEGIFQIASFHPEYLFAKSSESDPANYTNRSPYPMIHILRESSLDIAIASHPDTETIPHTNIAFAKQRGIIEMKRLRDLCFSIKHN